MERLIVLHGEESQLIEEKKNSYIKAAGDRVVEVFSAESGASRISEALREDSLFGESKIFILEDLPFLKKSSGKQAIGDFQSIYDYLLTYSGEHPVILVYHGNLDKRLKVNKEFLKVAKEVELKKMSADDMLVWTERYVKEQGYLISTDGRQYLRALLEIWGEVPLSFFKTEMDRLFLFLKDGDAITLDLLSREGSDFGAKNIFRFTDAFFKKEVKVLHQLLPFVLKAKEMDRFFAYFEGQLRLQLMVAELASLGMDDKSIATKLQGLGSTVKAYPVKLAYERKHKISAKEIAIFLEDFYEIAKGIRQSKAKPADFELLCYSYCADGR